jgi:mannosyltransferase OCH1-like enzyme
MLYLCILTSITTKKKGENMIPKVIHYCWFGGNPLPDNAKKCIATWEKECPDYEIKEWNESNFDIQSNQYVREAYENKRWAFVSDYVRLVALTNYGGIYLDTDVEVLKSLDPLLEQKGFCGFEENEKLCTAILGCEPEFWVFKEWLDSYEKRRFILEDGGMDEEPNVFSLTRICKAHGLAMNGQVQNINGFQVFSNDYFSPKSFVTGETHLTENSYTIHQFSESWRNNREKKMHQRQIRLIQKYGLKRGKFISQVLDVPSMFANSVSKRGLSNAIVHACKKILGKDHRS